MYYAILGRPLVVGHRIMSTTDAPRNAEQWKLFSCHRCGKCCTDLGLPYDPFRISEMAAFLNMSVEDVIHTYYGDPAGDGKNWIPDDAKRKPCPFLISEGHRRACRIYPVRPDGCRAFPFDTDNGTNGVECPAAKEVYVKLQIPRR